MKEVTISIDTLRIVWEWHYNPATDYRDPPEVTAAWREIAKLAGLNDRCTCGEDDNTDPEKSLPHKTWCPKAD